MNSIDFVTECYNEAIDFAVQNRDIQFLQCWQEGDWKAIIEEWPEFDINSEAQQWLIKESGGISYG
jgi:hypothetical protein